MATLGQVSLSGPQEHQGLKCPPLSVSVRHLSRRAIVFFCINLSYLPQQPYYAHGGSIMSKASLANLQSLWIKKTVIYQIWHAQKSLQSRLWKHLKQYSRGSAEVKCNIKYILDVSVGLWVLDACQHSVLSLSPWTTVMSFWAVTVLPLSNSALTVQMSSFWFQTFGQSDYQSSVHRNECTILIVVSIEKCRPFYQSVCRYAFSFVLPSLRVLNRRTSFTYASFNKLLLAVWILS